MDSDVGITVRHNLSLVRHAGEIQRGERTGSRHNSGYGKDPADTRRQPGRSIAQSTPQSGDDPFGCKRCQSSDGGLSAGIGWTRVTAWTHSWTAIGRVATLVWSTCGCGVLLRRGKLLPTLRRFSEKPWQDASGDSIRAAQPLHRGERHGKRDRSGTNVSRGSRDGAARSGPNTRTR